MLSSLEQEALEALTRENARLRADLESLDRKSDWLTLRLKEAEAAENQARHTARALQVRYVTP